MRPKVLGVAMGDWKVLGSDTFVVQVSATEVRIVDVFKDGKVEPRGAAYPLTVADSSIEGFGAFYRVRGDVSVATLKDLPTLGGRFIFAIDGPEVLLSR